MYLGAMSERCRSTGVALLLYFRTMEAMREQGAQALRDIVGSTNMSSMNLHATLIRFSGGNFHFGGGRDCYIRAKSRKTREE